MGWWNSERSMRRTRWLARKETIQKTLNEVSQAEKDKDHMRSPICGLSNKKMTQKNLQNRNRLKDFEMKFMVIKGRTWCRRDKLGGRG